MHKKPKKFYGNPPIDDDDEWTLAEFQTVHDGKPWRMASKKQNRSSPWITVKLFAVGSVPIKANYWLVYNGERWARNRDMGLLAKHRPELAEKIIKAADNGLFEE